MTPRTAAGDDLLLDPLHEHWDRERLAVRIIAIEDEAARAALVALKTRLLSEGDIRQRTIPNLSSDAYDGFLSLIDAALAAKPTP